MKSLATAITVLALAACSTNPDGSINWSDNPLNAAATKIDQGIQAGNRKLDQLPGTQSKRSDLTYDDLMKMGYIRRNPDYPKLSQQRYVFTSKNCNKSRQTLCLHPDANIAERP